MAIEGTWKIQDQGVQVKVSRAYRLYPEEKGVELHSRFTNLDKTVHLKYDKDGVLEGDMPFVSPFGHSTATRMSFQRITDEPTLKNEFALQQTMKWIISR